MTNRTLQRQLFRTGCTFAGLAVIFGAFGSHALKSILLSEQLETFEIGVRYQFMHALALIIIAISLRRLNQNVAQHLLYSFTAGIILFSFSLYLLSLKSILDLEQYSFIGAITPLGGVSLIGSWFYLGFWGLKSVDANDDSHDHRKRGSSSKSSSEIDENDN